MDCSTPGFPALLLASYLGGFPDGANSKEPASYVSNAGDIRDVALPLILNSPVLTSSSSWAFLWLRQLPGTLLFCLLGVLSPQTFAKLAPSYTNVLSSGKASSGHSI